MQDDPQTLRSIISQTIPQIGRLDAIIVRPARRVEAVVIAQTLAIVGVGLQHDRRGLEHDPSITKVSNRQVTLIQAEHIEVISKLMQLPNLQAHTLRRNLVISGINLSAIKPLFPNQSHHLLIGDVVLEITGICAPCSRIEELLGAGGYNVMRGHGGVNAKVIRGGILQSGDAVKFQVKTAQLPLAF